MGTTDHGPIQKGLCDGVTDQWRSWTLIDAVSTFQLHSVLGFQVFTDLGVDSGCVVVSLNVAA